ncbi:nuclear pore glycoprotein p62-like isoform X1 [Gigantopelta aegis]|uniref:nuclear pore glycoprotein p62-like isoform X1 n=1 Tax=Gigantopelta aegis TaxID=1735272 RepID=UPI001B887825|nr:nuclear pore glycoprotein p62-like isoform X1 [Gigantopelta aegis]
MFTNQQGGFSFGGTSNTPTTTTASVPGFSFGAPSTAASTGFSFGGTGAATTTSAASAPAGGFNFGNKASATTTGPTPSSTPGGFSFGGNRPAAPAAPAGFPFGAGSGSTGSFGFGAAGAAPATVSASSAATANTLSLALGQAAPTTTATVSGTVPTVGFGMGIQNAATSAPSAGFGMGTATTTTTTTTASSFSSLGFTVTSTPAAAPTTSTPGFGLGIAAMSTPATTGLAQPTGLPFGAAASVGGLTQPTAITSTMAPTAATSGFSLDGGLKSGFAAAATTTSSVPVSAGFSLGTPVAKTTASGFGLPQIVTSSAVSGSATGAVSSSTTALGKQMTYRQLEESINKWMAELEEQEQTFLQQATQVNAWDRLVMENGEKIIQLNKEVERVKMDQQKLDHELDFIHSQQRELKDLLSPLEKELDQLPSISYQQHADLEREHTYQLAENLDAQLKRMGQDLKEIIERLNATSATTDPQDPIQQITKILNAHMDSLLWIDRNTVALNRKMEEIGKQMDSQRSEQERNFRMAYNYMNK